METLRHILVVVTSDAPREGSPIGIGNKKLSIKLLQFNCNGLASKLEQIIKWSIENEVKIAALQETKCHSKSKLGNTGEYTLIRADRKSNSGGGLAFLVHKSVPFQPLPKPREDDHIEYMAIKVDNIAILNIYVPPSSSCSNGYNPSLTPYFPATDSIILGDFNAHDSLWNSALQDARGASFADEIGDSNFAPLNNDVPTRVPTNGQSSSPDFSLASLALLPYTNWEVKTELGSDHLPILITMETEIKTIKSENKTYMNFKKANWEYFKDKTEEKFATIPPPTDVYKGEKTFRKILNKVSKAAIPHGRIKEILPEVPSEAARLMKERDQRRQADPLDPEINELNNNITTLYETINAKNGGITSATSTGPMTLTSFSNSSSP